MGKVVESTVDARGVRLLIVTARFNEKITSALTEGALDKVARSGGDRDAVDVVTVPGAFELPLACLKGCQSGRYDAVVALGCVIRGGTPHFEYVCEAATDGVLRVQLETGVPVAFGVLTCDTLRQAQDRSGTGPDNKGCEAVEAAIEMVHVLRALEGERG